MTVSLKEITKEQICTAYAAEAMRLPNENYLKAFETQPWHYLGQIVDHCQQRGWGFSLTGDWQKFAVTIGEQCVSSDEVGFPLVFVAARAMVLQCRAVAQEELSRKGGWAISPVLDISCQKVGRIIAGHAA